MYGHVMDAPFPFSVILRFLHVLLGGGRILTIPVEATFLVYIYIF